MGCIKCLGSHMQPAALEFGLSYISTITSLLCWSLSLILQGCIQYGALLKLNRDFKYFPYSSLAILQKDITIFKHFNTVICDNSSEQEQIAGDLITEVKSSSGNSRVF